MKGVGRYLTKREVVKMFSNLILRSIWMQYFLLILTASGSLLSVLNSIVSLNLEKPQQGFLIILVTFWIWTYFTKETALYWNSLLYLLDQLVTCLPPWHSEKSGEPWCRERHLCKFLCLGMQEAVGAPPSPAPILYCLFDITGI